MNSTPFNILEAGIWENTKKEYYIVFVFLGVYTQNRHVKQEDNIILQSFRFLIGVERNMITLERTWIMFVLFTVAPLNPSHL